MKLVLSSVILSVAFSSSAFAGGNKVKFSHDNAKYRYELTQMEPRATVSKGYQTSTFKRRVKIGKGNQHSLRDPYNDPAWIKRDQHR